MKHFKRFLFVVLWMLLFAFIASMPIGFWLHQTLPAETSMAAAAGKMGIASLMAIIAMLLGLVLGLLGWLPGTQKACDEQMRVG